MLLTKVSHEPGNADRVVPGYGEPDEIVGCVPFLIDSDVRTLASVLYGAARDKEFRDKWGVDEKDVHVLCDYLTVASLVFKLSVEIWSGVDEERRLARQRGAK